MVIKIKATLAAKASSYYVYCSGFVTVSSVQIGTAGYSKKQKHGGKENQIQEGRLLAKRKRKGKRKITKHSGNCKGKIANDDIDVSADPTDEPAAQGLKEQRRHIVPTPKRANKA